MGDVEKQCNTLFMIGIITSILIILFIVVVIIDKIDPIKIMDNLGDVCYKDNDCISGLICFNGICLGKQGMTCFNNEDCVSNLCSKNICQ